MSSKRNPQSAILKILANKKAVGTDEISSKLAPEAKANERYAMNRSIRNMEASGLVEAIETVQSKFLRITPAGKEKFYSDELSHTQFPISKTWDGKWRIIILDVPESRKSEREALRYLLKKAGFACVKNSVWVSPLPFEQFFMNIKRDLGLTTELMIIVTDTLDEETSKIFQTYNG